MTYRNATKLKSLCFRMVNVSVRVNTSTNVEIIIRRLLLRYGGKIIYLYIMRLCYAGILICSGAEFIFHLDKAESWKIKCFE